MAAVAEELQQARDEVQRLRAAVSAARDDLDRARTGLINGLVEFSGVERATAEARAAAAERRPDSTIESDSTIPGEKKLATAKIALDAKSSELAEAERQLQILEGGQGASSAKILLQLTNMTEELAKKIEDAERRLLQNIVRDVSNKIQRVANKQAEMANKQREMANKQREIYGRQTLMEAFLRGDARFLPQLLKAGYSLRSLKAQNFSAAELKAAG